ncbi:uncharacterized protein LOC120351120 [Nilaparvata lugens]|uniref:uncharacterized protein LOC120351120 n=1 Tax=Nilaparvata lugens TaxID=108931 RepID=UPI00193E7BF9|nr:uncharacterized protein LOC120351120 [Nilaparvata lugens]
MLNALRGTERIHIDATFKTVPAQLQAHQLLTIHGEYMHHVLGGGDWRGEPLHLLAPRRTNNHLGSFHARMLAAFGVNLDVWSFIRKFRDIERSSFDDSQRIDIVQTT